MRALRNIFVVATALLWGALAIPSHAQVGGSPIFNMPTSGNGITVKGTVNLADTVISLGQYGAVCDEADGTYTVSITSGQNTLTATGASFVAGDVGKAIEVPGAGAAGAVLTTTISTVTDATHLILAANASTTLTTASKLVIYGHNDATAINAAFNAVRTASNFPGGAGSSSFKITAPASGKSCLILSSINMTGLFNSNTSFNQSTTVAFDGAQLICTTNATPCVDAIGDRAVTFRGVNIVGMSVNQPNIGMQVGRPTAAFECDRLYLDSPIIAGTFSLTPYLNVGCEETMIAHATFTNIATGAYPFIADGYNHFTLASAFQTVTLPTETPISFNDNTCLNCFIAEYDPAKAGLGIWLGNTSHWSFLGSYGAANAPENVILAARASTQNVQLTLDMHFEGSFGAGSPTETFLLTGPNATPNLNGLRYHNNQDQSQTQVFALDTGVTSATLNDVHLAINSFLNSPAIFDNPANYSMSGEVFVPSAYTRAATFSGCDTVAGAEKCSLNDLSVNYDSNATHVFFGTLGAGFPTICLQAACSSTNFALDGDGSTYTLLNAPSGGSILFRIANGATNFQITPTSLDFFKPITFHGATSGTLGLGIPATGASGTTTLPGVGTDFSATGGTSQVVKQTSVGGAFTVAQLAASDLSNGTSGSGAVALVGSPTFTGTAGAAALTTSGANTFNGISTGTAADVACLTSGHLLIQQAAASCTISSKRFKNILGPLDDDALRKIMAMPVGVFARKQDPKHRDPDPNALSKQAGVYAEDVASLMPLCAIYENDMKTPKGYRPECVIGYTIKAMQQQQNEIRAMIALLLFLGALSTVLTVAQVGRWTRRG